MSQVADKLSKEQIELHFHALSEYELCELFIKYPNGGALKKACLHFLGDRIEELFNTLERNAIDNKATISNVEVFVKSWKEEFEL